MKKEIRQSMQKFVKFMPSTKALLLLVASIIFGLIIYILVLSIFTK